MDAIPIGLKFLRIIEALDDVDGNINRDGKVCVISGAAQQRRAEQRGNEQTFTFELHF
jgi:hypothetical protein